MSANLSKLAALIVAVVLCASSASAQNNLTVADLKAYGDDASTATHALLSDDKITFTDTGGATGVLTWDSAGTEFELDNDLKLTAGGLWIGANQIIDSSRNIGSINNSTGSTNVVFSDTPTLATPNWTGTATGVGLTLSGALSAASTTFTGALTLPDGTAGAPGLIFTTDDDSGLYQSGDGYLDVAIGGARVARFGASELWLVQDLFLNGAADVIFDVDQDTYLASPSDDVFDFYIAGSRAGGFDASGDFDFVGDVDAVNLVLSGTATGMTNVSGTGNIALVNSPTFVTPTLGAASATSLALSGTLTGATNVSGTGNFALVGSPAFTGTVTGAALDFSGDLDGTSISIGGVEVIDSGRELAVTAGEVSGALGVGSLVSGGAVSGTTGTFSGNVGLSGNSRRLNLTAWTGSAGEEGRIVTNSNGDADNWIAEITTDAIGVVITGNTIVGWYGSAIRSFRPFRSNSLGSVGEPIYSFWSDSNTGVYSSGGDAVDFTTGGSRAGGFNSSNQFDVVGDRITIGGIPWITGSGSPESAVTAPVGSLYSRTDGGASTTLYVKESGTGNTGWAAK